MPGYPGTSLSGNIMRNAAGLLLFAVALAFPCVSMAADTGANTLGQQLYEIGNELWKPLFILISAGSFLAGLVLLAVGLTKLTKQHETRGGIWDSGMAHLVAAAMLISLPDAAGIGVTTLFGSSGSSGGLGASMLDTDGGRAKSGFDLASVFADVRAPGGTADCMSVEAPAECMARNLAENAIPGAIWTLFAFAFLIGLFTLASAIMDITKGQQAGGLPKGWGVKFLTSVLLLNGSTLYTFTTNTLLGQRDGGKATINEDGLVAGSSMLTYRPPGNAPDILVKYAELIGHCFTILAFFGAWAFIRGIFMLRAASEGRSQGTVGMALVYIGAGILLANSKYSSCMILTTMGGGDMATGFCR